MVLFVIIKDDTKEQNLMFSLVHVLFSAKSPLVNYHFF